MIKVLWVILVLALIPVAGSAQEMDSYIELLRSDIKTEKMAMITEVMQFTDDEATVFWPVYREYQFELDKLGDDYLGAIREYAENYWSLTDEKATELTKKGIKVREQRLDLQKDYYKKFSKILSPIMASRWVQLENQLGLLLELQVISEIPFAEKPAGK